MRLTNPRLLVPAALLLATSLAPALPAFADDASASAQPIVITAPYRPYWRVAPASTDPDPALPDEQTQVAGMTIVRGPAVYGDGDLLILDLGNSLRAVHMPVDRMSASDVGFGWTVEAYGPIAPDGSITASEVLIWPGS